MGWNRNRYQNRTNVETAKRKNRFIHNYPGSFSWEDAIKKAMSSNYAGHTDWRVPNSKELLSLVEWRCNYPAINLQYFLSMERHYQVKIKHMLLQIGL